VNTWKAIFAALVIFGAGFVTGNVLNRVAEHPAPAGPAHNAGRSPQQTLPLEQLRKVELMGCVQRELDLTPDQHAHIEKIIGDSQERIRDLWDQVAPDIHDEYEDVKKKLYEQLTPEQKKRFDELMKQQLHSHKPASTNAPPQALQEQKKTAI
jgi:Spy/CpxP family protein refolding chaperone